MHGTPADTGQGRNRLGHRQTDMNHTHMEFPEESRHVAHAAVKQQLTGDGCSENPRTSSSHGVFLCCMHSSVASTRSHLSRTALPQACQGLEKM